MQCPSCGKVADIILPCRVCGKECCDKCADLSLPNYYTAMDNPRCKDHAGKPIPGYQSAPYPDPKPKAVV